MSRKKMAGIVFFSLFLGKDIVLGSVTPSVDKMKSEIKKIDTRIAEKNSRIKVIGNEKLTLEKEIERNGREIEELRKEQQNLLEEIRKVERNIDYGVKNLGITSAERERVLKDNMAKLNIWNNHNISRDEDISPEIKFSFRKLIQDNYRKIERIENIDSDIKRVKQDVEQEKVKLEKLRNEAAVNSRKLDQKIVEQEKLIKKLNSEKVTHESEIKRLQNEKVRIEKEIERIIAARAKTVKKVSYSQAQKNVGKLSKPLQGRTVIRFNQKKNGVAMNGIEIRGELGGRVKAAASGKVIYSDDFQGLGKVVMIDYGSNLIGVYGNLISTEVKLGKAVKKGENIGVLGFSNEGQPDLYYELRFQLKAVNPESFF